MSSRFLLLVSLALGFATVGAAPSPSPAPNAPIEFDQFIIALLVRPANAPDLPKDELDKLQEQHIANLRCLHEEGKLLKAGPFEDYSGRNVRGMCIFATDSLEKAREWMATDPSIKAGRLAPEFLKWYVEKGSLK